METTGQIRPETDPGWRLTTFAADVTIPPGHPCMGGGIEPAQDGHRSARGDRVRAAGRHARPAGRPGLGRLVRDPQRRLRRLARRARRGGRYGPRAGPGDRDPPARRAGRRPGGSADPRGARGGRGRLRPGVRRRDGRPRRRRAPRQPRPSPARRITHLGIGRARVDAGRLEPPVRPARRFDLLPPDERVVTTRPPMLAPEGTIDPWLTTAQLLGRRRAAPGPEPLCRPPDELLRAGRGLGRLHRAGSPGSGAESAGGDPGLRLAGAAGTSPPGSTTTERRRTGPSSRPGSRRRWPRPGPTPGESGSRRHRSDRSPWPSSRGTAPVTHPPTSTDAWPTTPAPSTSASRRWP